MIMKINELKKEQWAVLDKVLACQSHQAYSSLRGVSEFYHSNVTNEQGSFPLLEWSQIIHSFVDEKWQLISQRRGSVDSKASRAKAVFALSFYSA